jgi:asparagine synthase (glutamine-hydrolysing)
MCDYDVVKHTSTVFGNIQKMQINEIMSLQLPHLLRYEDRNSMRHSVETRLPFLDYRLVEFCISIKPGFKIKDGFTKYILRRAIQNDLPESIVWRKNKFGFEAPTKTWFRDSKRKMRDEILGSNILKEITNDNVLYKSIDFMNDNEIWKYFMLAAWERNHNVIW